MNLALPPLFRASPASRVAVGLVALMISVLLLSDLFVSGFMHDPTQEAHRQRILTAEMIAMQVSTALNQHQTDSLKGLLNSSVRNLPELTSIAVFDHEGPLASAGDHAHFWQLAPNAPSSLDNLRTPLLVDGRPWGELQMSFVHASPSNVTQWLMQPFVLGIGLMSITGFVAFQFYLRRAMRYLDPSSAIPERVRTAFETLNEAVLVLDTSGHVMLANSALTRLAPAEAGTRLIGRHVKTFDWLVDALPPGADAPWDRTLHTNTPVLGQELSLHADSETPREVVMNCAPIGDGAHRARGCLITLSDVTELHERTEGLRVALAELHASREEIAKKNEELTLLATRDALTGCLNRRAFLAESEKVLAAAEIQGTPVCCVMCDVDHFKSINDRFGHGGGDEVLKAVAKGLARVLRTGDLLGRYGGEEFCMLLPGTDLSTAMQIGERLRAEVETNVGNSIRHISEVTVTMSFGIEQYRPDSLKFDTLVDRADQALYHSKQNGRNRVTTFEAMSVSA